jgi:hypothetical protein
MKLGLPAWIAELVGLIVSTLASFGFTVGGTIAEQAAIQSVLAGQVVVGLWEAAIGLLALVVGLYLVGYREWWPRVQRRRTTH